MTLTAVVQKSKALRKDNPRRGLQYATNVRLHVHRTACSAYWSVTEAQAVESAIISLFLPDDFDKADSALKMRHAYLKCQTSCRMQKQFHCRLLKVLAAALAKALVDQVQDDLVKQLGLTTVAVDWTPVLWPKDMASLWRKAKAV